ncbi:MAG: YlxR family protein [Oscillospiraceae bacterium]|nr:YlxR family protein [Oscillospiraceae bacterium]
MSNAPLTRRCCGCYEMKPKRELIRVVRSPEGNFMLDKTGKQNGRGAYLCQDATCLQTLRKKRGLDRSFKCSVPSEVYDALEAQLHE